MPLGALLVVVVAGFEDEEKAPVLDGEETG